MVREILFDFSSFAYFSFQGINLGPDYYAVEVGRFTPDMSLAQHHRLSRVRVMSDSLLAFFGKDASEIATPADIPWRPDCEILVCQNLVRDAVTTPLPVYGVRQWQHTKTVTTREGVFSVACKGYILSNLKTMFVDVISRSLVAPAIVVPEPLIWDDKDIFFDFLGPDAAAAVAAMTSPSGTATTDDSGVDGGVSPMEIFDL